MRRSRARASKISRPVGGRSPAVEPVECGLWCDGQACLALDQAEDQQARQITVIRAGGRTIDGVTARIAQRVLALTAAIWHNRATGQPVTRSLVAYDH